MNLKFIFVLSLIFLSESSFSQNWQWVKSAGGINHDFGTFICSDQAGFIYVAGYTIPTGSNMNMYASDYIKMSEGFHASEGSKFHAHIETQVDPFHANERVGELKNSRIKFHKENFYVTSFPNPFKDFATISVTSIYSSPITLDLFDNMGRLIKRLLQNAPMIKGTTNYYLSKTDLNLISGVYTCVISSLKDRKSIKLICVE